MAVSDKRLLNYTQRLRRLRYLAFTFTLALLIPLGALLLFGYQQLEKNILIEHQQDASNFVRSVNRKFFKKLTTSNTLPADAFDYYQQIYSPTTNQPQRILSPLSELDLEQLGTEQDIAGLIGYFQYDSQGRFNSPIWPNPLTADNAAMFDLQEVDAESFARQKVASELQQIVSESNTVQQILKHGLEREDELFYVAFDLADYFIFYRVLSIAGEKRLQGYVAERKDYLRQTFKAMLELRRFSIPALIALEGRQSSAQSEYFLYENTPDGETKVSQPVQFDSQYQQQPIYQSKLLYPLNKYSLSVSTSDLPLTASGVYSIVFIAILTAAILFACYGFYRLGLNQLALAEQRLNFVSSVSHELKTPLTSIRMYSEMLKDGTVASQQHQQDYFAFIFAESERLTRLINNILQLSKLSHQQQSVKPQYTQLSLLQDIIRSKTSSIIDKNGFQLNIIMDLPHSEHMQVLVEQDAFSQVIINITDNAVKFFDKDRIKDLSRQKINFIFRIHPNHNQLIQLEIRDYGEGISAQQEGKIFDLFYRGGSELTRTAQGTGIGLALVNELVIAQDGKIEVARKKPGLAILLSFHSKYFHHST